MKVNCINESIFVSESARADFDRLDPIVGAFCRAIGDLPNSGNEDAPEVILDGLGGLFDGLKRIKPTMHGQTLDQYS